MSDVNIERVNHHTRCMLDCETLYKSIDAKRHRLDMSWRAIGRQLGISPSTFSRLRLGSPPSANVLCSLIWWMDYGFIGYIRPNPRWSP